VSLLTSLFGGGIEVALPGWAFKFATFGAIILLDGNGLPAILANDGAYLN